MNPRFDNPVFADLRAVRRFRREHGIRATLRWLGSTNAPVSIQFLKYAGFGALTTVVHLGIFTWLSHTWFPAHDYLAPDGLPDALKQRHALISNLFAFPPAATVNYFFNIAFVFTTGRHSRLREFALFILVSLLSFAAGLFCGPFLISRGLDPWFAQGGLMVSSALVNFLCRKFLVFLR